MKRIKRKELKKDEFVSTINKVVLFFGERKKEFMALGVLFLFVILIFIGFRLARVRSNKRENRLLTQIIELSSELNDNPENVAKLEELAGKGKFTRLAYIFLATHFLEKGDYDQAAISLERMKKSKKDIFYYKAQDLLAQIQVKRKNYDKAIDIYKKIEEENPKEYSLDVILFHRAEVYEEKGEIEEALSLYQKIKEDFPLTNYGADASQKIIKLEEKK